MIGDDEQQQGETIPRSDDHAKVPPVPGEDKVLRAKYLDWCSAQLADRFLALSPDEIFELAERAARGDEQYSGRSLSASDEDGLASYRAVVARVTEVLAGEMDLPSFAEWLDLYHADPATVEARLLGLWREKIQAEDPGDK